MDNRNEPDMDPTAAVAAAPRDRGGRFRKGRSGNPAGRPVRLPGLAERLAGMAAAEAEAVVSAAIGRAKGGDAAAAGLVLGLALDVLPASRRPRVAGPEVAGAAADPGAGPTRAATRG